MLSLNNAQMRGENCFKNLISKNWISDRLFLFDTNKKQMLRVNNSESKIFDKMFNVNSFHICALNWKI